MSKVPKTMKFDEDLWKAAEKASKQTRQSTTAYIETATEEKIKRDVREGKITLTIKK